MSRDVVGLDDVAPLIDIQNASFGRAGRGLLKSWPPSEAMQPQQLADFLSSHRYAVLATTRPDDRPHAAPVGFVVVQGVFWFASVAGARLRNLEQNRHASLVVIEGEDENHRALLIEGTTILHPPHPELHDLWATRFNTGADWAAAFIELRPNVVFSYAA